MSTEDDRPRHASGYSNTGGFATGPESYSGSGTSNLFDEGGYSTQSTSILPGTNPYDAITDEPAAAASRPLWHGGADLGLLVLRLVAGGLFIAHGLSHLFGWFQGKGLTALADQLAGFGYHDTTALAWVTGLSELVGGTFVALGLFTPAGAAAMLGVLVNVIVVKFNGKNFAGDVELELLYAAAAFAVLFAGPGRVALDRPTPWYRHAPAYGIAFLLIAAAASVTVLLVFR
ncbi:MAG: DoxX family protein [Labedaea sp.]